VNHREKGKGGEVGWCPVKGGNKERKKDTCPGSLDGGVGPPTSLEPELFKVPLRGKRRGSRGFGDCVGAGLK